MGPQLVAAEFFILHQSTPSPNNASMGPCFAGTEYDTILREPELPANVQQPTLGIRGGTPLDVLKRPRHARPFPSGQPLLRRRPHPPPRQRPHLPRRRPPLAPPVQRSALSPPPSDLTPAAPDADPPSGFESRRRFRP